MSKPVTNTGEHVEGVGYARRLEPGRTMVDFDKLPRVVRRAIAEAPCRYNIRRATNMLKGGLTPHEVATDIGRASEIFISAAYAQRGVDL